MKHHNLLPALAALLLLSGASSCSLFQKNSKSNRDNSLPTDRESLLTPVTTKTYTSDEISKGVIRGDWAIETVNNKKAVGQTAPFLKFVDKEHRVYGNNGCNVINASYKYNPKDTTLRFSDVATTMMYCEVQGITDYDINNAINNTRYYSWELRGSEYWLYFYDARHQRVMSLMHQNFDFLNGSWKVTAINGNPIDIDNMYLVIDVEEGKLHGNTGCNIINGTFTTDMDAANSISFQEMMMTRMACPNDKYETDLVVALEDAAFAKPVSPDRVLLLDNRSNAVLQLDRTVIKEEQ